MKYKIEWKGRVGYTHNGFELDRMVQDVLDRGFVPTITSRGDRR